MKTCPKCNKSHNKPGTYCSRSCSNSRAFSDESKKLKSEKNKKYWGSLPDVEKQSKLDHLTELNALRSKKWKSLSLDALMTCNFDELSFGSKRKRVIIEQNDKCNKCGIDTWQGKPLSLEIDHINGISDDNTRSNLEALCPNCHSITDTWRGKNKPSKNGKSKVSDDLLLEALKTESSIRQALLKVGLAAKGANYSRAKRLLKIL